MGLILRFLKEYVKWTLKGKPIRSDQEMGRIFSICEGCPFFQRYAPGADFGICGKCGCNLDKTDKGRNKIAWGTTKCPDNRWG